MKIPAWLASLVFGAVLTLQGWTLTEIVNLKVAVAALNQQVNQTHIAKTP